MIVMHDNIHCFNGMDGWHDFMTIFGSNYSTDHSYTIPIVTEYTRDMNTWPCYTHPARMHNYAHPHVMAEIATYNADCDDSHILPNSVTQ